MVLENPIVSSLDPPAKRSKLDSDMEEDNDELEVNADRNELESLQNVPDEGKNGDNCEHRQNGIEPEQDWKKKFQDLEKEHKILKRKMTELENEHEDFEETLRRHLQCPVCRKDIRRQRFKVCVNHHVYCDSHANYSCMEPSEAENIELFDLLLSRISFKCKFFKDGCQVSARSHEIVEHEGVCDFSPKKCSTCKMFFKKDDFRGHGCVQLVSPVSEGLNSVKIEVKIPKKRIGKEWNGVFPINYETSAATKIYGFKIHNTDFYIKGEQIMTEKTWIFYVASMGQEKERSCFTASIVISNPEDESKATSLKTDLVPVMVRHDKRALRDTGSCLMISDRNMEKFFVVGEELDLLFTISVTIDKQ